MKRYAVKLSVVAIVGVVAFGYTNCAQNYDLSTEQLSQSLNAASAILINSGAKYTNSPNVTVQLVTESASEVYLTSAADCTAGGSWDIFANTKSWQLQNGDGKQSVFAKFKSASSSTIESSCVNASIILDTIPPELALQTPAELTNKNQVAFSFSATDALSGVKGFDCKSDAGWTTACSQGSSTHAIAEGNHWVKISALDLAGNRSEERSFAFLSDQTPPSLKITNAPASITSSLSGIIEFEATDALTSVAKRECRIDNSATHSPWTDCTSPFTVTATSGTNTVSVRASDLAGNLSNIKTVSWVVDSSAPDVQITSRPSQYTSSQSAEILFTGTDDGQAITKFDCKLDGGEFGPCTSPQSLSSLAVGSHEFWVRGYDSANNVSPAVKATWFIDKTNPTLAVTSSQSGRTKSTTAVVSYTKSDNSTSDLTVTCSLDDVALTNCGSPINLQSLSEGAHFVTVAVQDAAGNTQTSRTGTWVVDLTPPVVTITSGPDERTTSKTASFTFGAVDPAGGVVSTLLCALDGSAFAACPSAPLENLADGSHTFQVQATDSAGNVGLSAVYTWLVDTTAPAIVVSKKPADAIELGSNAEIIFDISDDGVGIESSSCLFDGVATACTDGHLQNSTLGLGDHSLIVDASDKLGNRSSTTVSFAVVESTRPVTQPLTVTVNNKADVLVVMDNSISMDYERSHFASSLANLTTVMSGLDWQIGVVTTEIGDPNLPETCTKLGCTDKTAKDGRLVQISSSIGYVLKKSQANATTQAALGSLLKAIPAGTASGAEQGIKATYRSIERIADSNSVNSPNRTLFRNDAVLSVIIVSDENESPTSSEYRNDADALIGLIKAKWPSKPFAVHSIIVRPGDTACIKSPVNVGSEEPGDAYANLTAKTGGILGSVCEADYSAQLASIGKATVDQVNTATLECAPLDTNKDGKADVEIVTASGATAPSYTISGLTISFASPLPAGTNSLNYKCAAK